jgi:hypothetical protein
MRAFAPRLVARTCTARALRERERDVGDVVAALDDDILRPPSARRLAGDALRHLPGRREPGGLAPRARFDAPAAPRLVAGQRVRAGRAGRHRDGHDVTAALALGALAGEAVLDEVLRVTLLTLNGYRHRFDDSACGQS